MREIEANAGLNVDIGIKCEEYNMSRAYIAIIVFLLGNNCSSKLVATGQQDYLMEESAVYRAYIDNYYLKFPFPKDSFDDTPFTMVVISDHTSGFMIPLSYKPEIEKLSPRPSDDTIKSFLEKNDGLYPQKQLSEQTLKTVGRYPINRHIKLAIRHVLISDREREEIFKDGRWSEFFRRYPGSRGIVYLSRVGFNVDMTEALLYFSHSYYDNAEGLLIYLKGIEGNWRQVAERRVWIS
jgi:hypothetical protein